MCTCVSEVAGCSHSCVFTGPRILKKGAARLSSKYGSFCQSHFVEPSGQWANKSMAYIICTIRELKLSHPLSKRSPVWLIVNQRTTATSLESVWPTVMNRNELYCQTLYFMLYCTLPVLFWKSSLPLCWQFYFPSLFLFPALVDYLFVSPVACLPMYITPPHHVFPARLTL